jgi:NADH:ubiquinone oxidoreductase subunit 5 (subunit L)/multisubunit Na+/H+ antiporter MnhA subunit
MVAGGMAAAAHYETRRILSYHIISQIGYMIMGLGIFTPLAIAGAVFFTMHNMIAKTNTFLVSGMINKARGTFELKEIGGLFKESPFLAVLFCQLVSLTLPDGCHLVHDLMDVASTVKAELHQGVVWPIPIQKHVDAVARPLVGAIKRVTQIAKTK